MITCQLKNALCAVALAFAFGGVQAQKSAFEHFVTASGDQLYDGEKPYRFISFNIPNLNFIEDEMAFNRPHPFRLPNEYEIRDALESVKAMGGRVARIYTLPVRRETDTDDIPRYVLGPGQFDERSFQTLDTMMAVANEVGVRIIFPLVNNWKWMGGRPQYAAFRGKTEDEFWTDRQLIEDFKKTIAFTLNRTNTVTGVKYKDDKAIMCWETGNELTSPYSWTKEIAAYIKSIDKNHLLMDGYHAIDDHPVREETITDPNIDIVNSHHYELNPAKVLQYIEANRKIIDGRKPYVLGEFGFIGTHAIGQTLDSVIAQPGIAGALIWSLRFHRREGGFYWHSEPLGGGIYKAYHYPGFASGEEYDEKDLIALMTDKAYEIREKEVSAPAVPQPPELLPVEDVSNISWRGSTGASAYDVERSERADGPWTVVGADISDASAPYAALFHDKTAEIGKSYYYRARAKNKSGVSAPSAAVGPVTVRRQALIDDMRNFSDLYYSTGAVRIDDKEDRVFKEILYRLEAEAGAELTYYAPGKIVGWKVSCFAESGDNPLSFSVSADGVSFKTASSGKESFFAGKGDYNYWSPILYQNSDEREEPFLKITATDKVQIGRVEIYYK